MSARNPADLCVCGQPAGDHDCPGDPCHPAVIAMLEYSLQVHACSACGTEDETVAPGGTALCRWCSELSALLQAPDRERRWCRRVLIARLTGLTQIWLVVLIWLVVFVVMLVLRGGYPPYGGGMAQIYLNVEWGETPFRAEGWPCPLIRPEPYGADLPGCPPITIPDALMERYQAAEAEFLAVQAELRVIAKEHGDIGL